MDNISIPQEFADAAERLSESGFSISGEWYHGTASGLVESIQANGLIGGGDKETTERLQNTLGTIGNRKFETSDPVFLTQSKELAYYWALKKAHTRNVYFQKNERPVVFQVAIAPEQVKPDAGAIAILLEPSNEYILFLKETYEKKGLEWDEINPLEAERAYFVDKLGMAYSFNNIPATDLELLADAE